MSDSPNNASAQPPIILLAFAREGIPRHQDLPRLPEEHKQLPAGHCKLLARPAVTLDDMEFTNVQNLEGGVTAWTDAGLPVAMTDASWNFSSGRRAGYASDLPATVLSRTSVGYESSTMQKEEFTCQGMLILNAW